MKIIDRFVAAGSLLALTLAGCAPAGDDQPAVPASPSVGASAAPPEAGSASTDPERRESEEIPEGMQARWWTWAAAEPPATNPVEDLTGSQCARNQPPDVWFLAGTFGGLAKRRCTVPAGRPILVPMANLVTTDRAGCDEFLAGVDGRVEFGVHPMTPRTVTSQRIDFEAVAGNPVTDGEGGSFHGIACGLWVLLPPPGPGTHTLVVRATAPGLAVYVDYTLTVAPRR